MESKSKKYLIVKYSELSLKGGNKKIFAKHVCETIRNKIKNEKIFAIVDQKKDFIIIKSEKDLFKIPIILKYIVGLSSYSFVYEYEESKTILDEILNNHLKIYPKKTLFRISLKLLDSDLYNNKDEIIKYLAWKLINDFDFEVDLQNYDVDINIRFENKKLILVLGKQELINGLPAGINGKFLTLLSGGIDSPVSAFKTITRGLNSSFITFLTPKTSSVETISKIKKLAKIINKYNSQNQKLFIVNFQPIQEEIMKLEDSSYRIILLRIYFMKFSEMVSKKYHYKFLVTGDSLGQVASQTPESMQIIDNSIETLIVRPLVSMSKEEIIKIAYKINSYEISILKGDDMCSLFTPKSPVIFPKKFKIREFESKLNKMDDILKNVFENNMRIIELE